MPLREPTPEELQMYQQAQLREPTPSELAMYKLENQMKGFQTAFEQENLGGLPEVAKEVRTMPWAKQALIAAGHETDKLMAGTKDLMLFGRDLLGDKNAVYEHNLLEQEQAEKDLLYRPFQESAGLSSKLIGGSTPYFVTGGIGGKPAASLAEKIINKAVIAPVNATKVAAKSLPVKIADVAAKSTNPTISKYGKQAQDELIQPMLQNTMRKKAQPSLPDPYYKGLTGRVAGGAGLGAIEGGLHYDNTIGEGAVAGLSGSLIGEKLRPATNRLPDYRTQPTKDLLEWYKDQGGLPSHGLDSGSRRLQNFESQLEKSQRTADAAALYNQENQLVNNKVAYKAMGIEDAKNSHLTPEELKKHQESLQSQYEELEAGTKAKFTKAELDELATHASMAELLPGAKSSRNAKIVAQYVKDIKQLAALNKDPLTGKIVSNNTLQGKDFKSIRSQLQKDITEAYKADKMSLVSVLTPIKSKLDEAVERGVKEANGDVVVEQWKDLNRKYAATNIVYEHGMTPQGVDPKLLYSYFRTADGKRFALEDAPDSIKDLMKLAKVDYLKRNQDKSFGGIKNSANLGLVDSLIGTPVGGMLPGFERLALSMYKKGYPARTGLLNMGVDPRKKGGFLSLTFPELWEGPGMYTRSLAQSAQVAPKIKSFMQDVYDKLGEGYESLR